MLVHSFVARLRGMFYGWWIVIVGITSVAITSGLYFHGFQFYVDPLRQEFNWSYAVISGAFSLARAENGFLGPVGGWFVQRFGPRKVLVSGTLIFGLGFILLALTRNIPTFYIAFLLLSIGAGLGSWTPITASITNWFRRKRSKAIGFMMLGMGLGGVAVAPAVGYLISATSWKTTVFISAVFALVVLLPLARLVHQDPESRGYLPDGTIPKTLTSDVEKLNAKGQAKEALQDRDEVNFTVKQALKSPNFWFLSIGHGLALMTVSTLSLHLVPFLESEGFSKASAAQAVAILTGVSMGGPLVGGILGDKYPKQYIAAATMLLHTIALYLLASASGFGIAALALIIQGVAWGTRGPILTAMRGDLFGRKNFPVINGFTQLVTMVGQIAAPLYVGIMADNNRYGQGIMTISAATLAGAFLFLFIKMPRPDAQTQSKLP